MKRNRWFGTVAMAGFTAAIALVAAALSSVRLIPCTLTAYTVGPESTGKHPGDPGYGITASGVPARPGRTVAVDPQLIPYHTRLFIPGLGLRVAEDTGGAIQQAHIDILMAHPADARRFGVHQDVLVWVLPDWFPSW